jgi:hypothetical protein
MPPLNIRKPQTLFNRLEKMEAEAMQEAQNAGILERVHRTARINGATVTFTVTPTVRRGQFYRYFRIDGKLTPKETVAQRLLPVAV